jgi:hypothetical protein
VEICILFKAVVQTSRMKETLRKYRFTSCIRLRTTLRQTPLRRQTLPNRSSGLLSLSNPLASNLLGELFILNMRVV